MGKYYSRAITEKIKRWKSYIDIGKGKEKEKEKQEKRTRQKVVS